MTGGIRASGVSDYHRGRDSPGRWMGQDQERRTGHSTNGTKIGWEMRQDVYSAAVIDGIKRNSRIYVGDAIVRKTDSRLSNGSML